MGRADQTGRRQWRIVLALHHGTDDKHLPRSEGGIRGRQDVRGSRRPGRGGGEGVRHLEKGSMGCRSRRGAEAERQVFAVPSSGRGCRRICPRPSRPSGLACRCQSNGAIGARSGLLTGGSETAQPSRSHLGHDVHDVPNRKRSDLSEQLPPALCRAYLPLPPPAGVALLLP